MTNISTPAITVFDSAAAIFESIRPAAVKYGDAVRTAERREADLASHADISKVWDRMAHLTTQNETAGKKNPSRGVSLDVAREVLNLPGLTLTREDGKDLTPDQKRLEALKKWMDRNQPKDDAPRPFRLAVTASGEGPVTGTLALSREAHPDVYAALLDILAAAQTGE